MESIKASVGRNGANRFEDASVIQCLLNDCLYLLFPYAPLEPDGKVGPKTIDLIEAFQRQVVRMLEPNGLVEAAGQTLAVLNQRAWPAFVASPFAAFLPTITGQHKFPLPARPSVSYKTGMRRFGSNRRGERKHAGCDLYAPVGMPIYAMDEGEVLKDVYAFYLGTHALEVQHPNFVARYGEISQVAGNLKKGDKVSKGQIIAYVGELKSLNMSMLHLELYSGDATGSLTDRSNSPYKRRRDLIDPTPILDRAL